MFLTINGQEFIVQERDPETLRQRCLYTHRGKRRRTQSRDGRTLRRWRKRRRSMRNKRKMSKERKQGRRERKTERKKQRQTENVDGRQGRKK